MQHHAAAAPQRGIGGSIGRKRREGSRGMGPAACRRDGPRGHSLALCGARHVEQTCLKLQADGKRQAPAFHDVQIGASPCTGLVR